MSRGIRRKARIQGNAESRDENVSLVLGITGKEKRNLVKSQNNTEPGEEPSVNMKRINLSRTSVIND